MQLWCLARLHERKGHEVVEVFSVAFDDVFSNHLSMGARVMPEADLPVHIFR